jgi:amino acid adenylation domain-containing protein/thioester reductase-like protein
MTNSLIERWRAAQRPDSRARLELVGPPTGLRAAIEAAVAEQELLELGTIQLEYNLEGPIAHAVLELPGVPIDESSLWVLARRIDLHLGGGARPPSASWSTVLRWHAGLEAKARLPLGWEPPPSLAALARPELEPAVPGWHRIALNDTAGRRLGDDPEGRARLLLAFAAVVGRSLDVSRIALGVEVPGRVFAELDDVVGCLDRALPESIDLGPESGDRLSDLIARSHRWPELHAYGSHGPLGDGTLPSISIGFSWRELPELTHVAVVSCESDWESWSLLCRARRHPSGALELALRGHHPNVHPAMLARLGQRLERALAAWTDERQPPLRDANDDRAWAPPTPAVASEGHLLSPFIAECRANPSSIALIDPQGTMTRAELLSRAEGVARSLRARRVGPGARVGVYGNASNQLIVAIYGVLLAGAAYVPLDPRDPAQRLELRGRLAELSLVVYCEQPPPLSGIPHVRVDECPLMDEGLEALLESAGEPELAYVIFTSGSTATPKTVAVGHRSVTALIAWARTQFDEAELDRALLTAPVSFDMSVFGLFVPLAGPGAIVVVPDLGWLLEHEAPSAPTLLYTVPTALAALLRAGALPQTVRTVNLGGEPLGAALVEQLLAAGVERVCNLYGPTESTSNALFEDYRRPTLPTIGRPIAGTGAAVRRSDGTFAWIGEPGELELCGIGLARGYLGQPQLDAERFVIRDQIRFYRTGDRAVWLPDGRFQFLGRVDLQLKIRGHRVESSELEHHLTQLEGVHAAACRVSSGGSELIAWLVPAHEAPAHASDAAPEQVVAWSAELGLRLPAYLHPNRWVLVPSLPSNSRGKLDHDALPLPARTSGIVPTTELEAEILAAWQQVLGVSVPSRDTSFFALGGHSLLALALVREISERTGRRLGLEQLFEAPTLAGLTATLDAAPRVAAQSELSQDLARRFEPFDLNAIQQAYWIGARSDVALGGIPTTAYFEIDVPSALLERIHAALDRLCERHDMLRAVVAADGRQRVLPTVSSYPLSGVDLREFDGAELREQLATRRAELRGQSLDPEHWPLLRISISTLPDERVRLHVSVPALLFDAHSLYLLAAELLRLVEKPDTELEPIAIGYREVLTHLATLDHGDAASDWRERLPNFPAGPSLPRRPDRAREQPKFVRLSCELEPDEWASLRERAARRDLTPSSVLLAIYAQVLLSFVDQPHLGLAVTVFDRPRLHPDIDRIVGDFTSVVLVEIDGRTAPSFAEFGYAIQRRLWWSLDRRGFGAVDCIRELRRLGREHEFPVVFTSTLGIDVDLAAGFAEIAYAITQTSQVWIDLKVRESRGRLQCNWDVLDGLLSPGVAEAMVELHRELLGEFARSDAPWTAAIDARPLPHSQRAQRAAFNDNRSALAFCPLHLGVRAGSRPEALALVDGPLQLTRVQLESGVASIAARLQAHGLRREQRVAVLADRGWASLVAAAGIMAAGGAYVPIDPAWPAARIARVLARAQASLGIGPAPQLRAAGLELIDLSPADLDADERVPDIVTEPAALAYVMFTSGSTGEPKGVAISHGAASNTLADVNARFAVTHTDRVYGISSLCFDLSVFDVFGSLQAGAALVLCAAEQRRDPGIWIAAIIEHGVTIWNSVPTLVEMLVEELERRAEVIPGVRLIMMSGDWIPLPLLPRIRAVFPRATLVSLGGATEAAIWSIIHPITDIDPSWTSVPYGRPLRNQSVEVFGPTMAPRPDWAVGEIHIGGVGLARGYLDDPERSAASFIERNGTHWYKTGDLGRFRPDGWIEFLGRRDHQVKIRGHRVELGEIEAALVEQLDVEAAVVVAPMSTSGQRRLLAYYVGAAQPEQLRRKLLETLPVAHVPSELRRLDALPLSVNGKVDRAALARPTASMSGSETLRSSLVEQTLASFRAVLEQPGLGPDDDFFAHGGDSLSALRLLARLRESMGHSIPVRELFDRSTARKLAESLERLGKPERPAASEPMIEASFDVELRAQAKHRRGRRPELAERETQLLPQVRGLWTGLAERHSPRSFAARPIDDATLLELLAVLRTLPSGRRLAPSTGGAYGLQCYIQRASERSTGQLDGTWFVDADVGALRRVSAIGFDADILANGPNTALARSAAFALLLVVDLETLGPLYGEDALRLGTLEAGYLGQLLCQRASDLGLALTPVGSLHGPTAGVGLELPGTDRVVHGLLGGVSLSQLIRADSQASARVSVRSRRRNDGRTGVLLTGATGFLGSALLSNLLAEPGRTIHCLVRARDQPHAEERLAAALPDLDPAAHSRLRAWVGDVASPGLGLTDPQALAESVSEIIHAAADVSFSRSYEQLRGTNVSGTIHVLEFAAANQLALHHVSSISVFRASGTGPILESCPVPEQPPEYGGYSQSKWASERATERARAAGLDIHVSRLGLVVGNPGEPHDRRDYLACLIRGCLELGAIPDIEMPMPIVTRRTAAAAILAARGTVPATWHVVEPQPLHLAEFAARLEALGKPLRRLPVAEWLTAVDTAISEREDHPLGPHFQVIQHARIGGVFDPAGPSGGQLDSRWSWTMLGELGVRPTLDSALARVRLIDSLTGSEPQV